MGKSVLCRMNLRLSPPCLLLSPNKLWVLWAAGSYTCFPLVFYCLTVRCSVGALGYFGLPVCHAARFQKQFIVGFVGASLGW